MSLMTSATVARLRAWLIDQPRLSKRILLLCNDFLLLQLAVWLAFSARWGRLYVPENAALWFVLLAAPVAGIAVFQALGLYRLVTRFLGQRGAMRIFLGVGLSVLLWAVVVLMVVGSGDPDAVVPRSVVFIYPVFAGALVWASREAAVLLLRGAGNRVQGPERRRVVIFGAGTSGVQLLEALRRSGDYEPIGFIDDTASLIGQRIGGLKVYRVDKLPRLVERDGIKEVLLALPERQRRERQAIIRRIAVHAVRVKTMPAMEDIASGRVSVTDLKAIDVDDLLGRDPVPPNPALLTRAIRDKSVMITGAGGSIGFELTRQILRQRPRRLVLFDISEVALYEVETEIVDALAKAGTDGDGRPRPEIVAVLGSVLDATLLERTIKTHGVETIYHAAAYKHVPIVEANPVAGLRNNTFGTLILADVAERTGVERVTLVSTDKAVRPTNIMGASKRLAELIFQASAAEGGHNTIFTMVRFGNVLDSSGSVVRRFRKQIQEGGPVTVTHPDVIRYFMSIPEAATLVLQASAMAQGGEVFVLDMGEPVKIDELARTMIRLMGLEVLDEANPTGDIAIKYVGLRPGEKLFEELLLDERTTETEHPRIRRNNEPFRSKLEMAHELKTLESAMLSGRVDAIKAVLARAVEEYRPETHTVVAEVPAIVLPGSRTIH
ncbi:MAG: polysaccharide biosynthesis protein [Hyphomicrobiaceae bacterium]